MSNYSTVTNHGSIASSSSFPTTSDYHADMDTSSDSTDSTTSTHISLLAVSGPPRAPRWSARLARNARIELWMEHLDDGEDEDEDEDEDERPGGVALLVEDYAAQGNSEDADDEAGDSEDTEGSLSGSTIESSGPSTRSGWGEGYMNEGALEGEGGEVVVAEE